MSGPFRRAVRAVPAVVIVVVAALVGSSAQAQSPPSVGLGKNYFTVNGQPQFLTFVSYFAALRPGGSSWGATWTPSQKAAHLAEVEGHFALLKSYGFGGVRIFPNWAWSFTIINGCDIPDPNSVMKPAAGASVPSPIPGKPNTTWLNTQALEMLHQVLLAAGRQQLIVEVAWNNEQVRAINPANNIVLDRLTPTEYASAMAEVVTQLAGLHPHMYYDLQNEYNLGVGAGTPCPKDTYTGAALGSILPTLRAIDGTRKFTASFTAPPGQTFHQVTVNDAYAGTFDLVSYHDPRNYSGTTALWPSQTATNVSGLRSWVATKGISSVWKPVLFSEPDRWLCCTSPQSSLTATNFRTAVGNAKSAGAAGWTFHTEAFFKNAAIPGGNIPASVAPGFSIGTPEWDFVTTFNSYLAGIAWGIPQVVGSLDTPSPSATVNSTFGVSGWAMDLSAATAAATTVTFYRSNTPNVPQVFAGSATIVARPDVAAIYGSEFVNAGFAATLTFPVGAHYLVVAVADSLNGVVYYHSVLLNVVP